MYVVTALDISAQGKYSNFHAFGSATFYGHISCKIIAQNRLKQPFAALFRPLEKANFMMQKGFDAKGWKIYSFQVNLTAHRNRLFA